MEFDYPGDEPLEKPSEEPRVFGRKYYLDQLKGIVEINSIELAAILASGQVLRCRSTLPVNPGDALVSVSYGRVDGEHQFQSSGREEVLIVAAARREEDTVVIDWGRRLPLYHKRQGIVPNSFPSALPLSEVIIPEEKPEVVEEYKRLNPTFRGEETD